MSENLVSQIPQNFFRQISAAALNNLKFMKSSSKEQRQQIPGAIIQQLQSKDIIDYLEPENIAHIPRRFLQDVKGNSVAYIRVTDHHLITQQQINSITDSKALNMLCQKNPELFLIMLSDRQLAQIDRIDNIRNLNQNQRAFLKPEVVQKLPLSTLWLEPINVLKKASALQKFVLFTGLFMQSIVMSFITVLFTVTLGLLAFIPFVRFFIRQSWRLTAYSWRCFKIF
jgi:hypothetical protein